MASEVAAWGMALVVLAALLVGALRSVRRRAAAARMRVLERLPLDGRRALYLVEIDGRQLVVGGGEGGPLQLVTELAPAPPEAARLALVANRD